MTPITAAGAPAAIGPYSQAIEHLGVLYCSGQIALDPVELVVKAKTVAEETVQVLANLDAVLRAAGSAPENVLKTTVYLRDMADFAEMNAAYQVYFGAHRPARATVAVAGLPRNVRVEIDCIAALDVR